MSKRNDNGLSDKPVIVIVGLIASCIAIFSFITGWQNVSEIFRAQTSATHNNNKLSTTPTEVPISTSTFYVQATPTPIVFVSPDLSFNYEEEFNTSLDGSKWEVSGPATSIANNALHMESTSISFPFIYTNQNLFPPQGNFVFDASLTYPIVTGNGVGLAITNVIPPLGSESNRSQDILRIWQDDGQKFSIYFRGILIYQSSSIDQLQHQVELRYDGKYQVILDGSTIFTSYTDTERPSVIWIGNPFQAAYPTNWSQLNIYYIKIYSYY